MYQKSNMKPVFKSKFEGEVYSKLVKMVGKRRISYETVKLSYTLTKNYYPDFIIKKKNGEVMYVEAKGLGRAFDSAARTKMRCVKEQHPEKDIRLVFMRDGPIAKKAKMTASQWAEKYGFPWAIGSPPKEWFEE